MKTRLTALMLGLLLAAPWALRADETITVTATDSDISANLDLKAVATLFGEAKNLEDFENKLNDPEARISNLDLNGDGDVDYLRVVETNEGKAHLIVLQAILAKDIYQDVASIYVEKDEATQQVTVQIIGDEYVYGTNYVIEPVYVYTPVIYDWFWGPAWYCWTSPYYWGYYPSYWYAYNCWMVHDYWHHIYDFHHHHPYCSYRNRPHPVPAYATMRPRVARYDYATIHPERSFARRNVSRQVTNARDLQPVRSGSRTNATTRGVAAAPSSRTFESTNVRSTTRVSSSASRSNAGTAARAQAPAAGRSTSTSTTRTTANTTASRSTSASATTSRSTAATSASRTATSASATSGRTQSTAVSRASAASVNNRTSTATTRSSVSNATRSSSAGSRVAAPRTSSSSSRVGTSYSGGTSRSGGMSSGGARSTGGGSSSRSGGSTRR